VLAATFEQRRDGYVCIYFNVTMSELELCKELNNGIKLYVLVV
jgi:hypothetical protein